MKKIVCRSYDPHKPDHPMGAEMKRSELTTTGKTYLLTPDDMGDAHIIIDESLAIQSFKENNLVYHLEDESEMVEITRSNKGFYFAILEPFTRNGKTYNENLYRECENIEKCQNGLACMFGSTWKVFDDEE
jgi:hypothetical protein